MGCAQSVDSTRVTVEQASKGQLQESAHLDSVQGEPKPQMINAAISDNFVKSQPNVAMPEPEPEPGPEIVAPLLALASAHASPFTVYSHCANDPNEDRYTICADAPAAAGRFFGVFDGNGGGACAEYLSSGRASECFYDALSSNGLDAAAAFRQCWPQLDSELLTLPLTGTDRFCGSCAVAAHIITDVSGGARVVTVANLGDSRAVLGIFGESSVRTVELSRAHSASVPHERELLAGRHGCAVDEVVVNRWPEREGGDWRVKGLSAVTRALGLPQLKTLRAAQSFNQVVARASWITPRPGVPR